jgi:hypothetical protein
MANEYQGEGGSFLLDPKTGKRKLIQRTEPAQSLNPQTEELSDGSADPQTPNPGED